MEEICRDYLATIPFPFSRWASIASSVPSKNCTRESVFEGAPLGGVGRRYKAKKAYYARINRIVLTDNECVSMEEIVVII